MLVKVNARLVDPRGVEALEGLTAELFDKDVLSDDSLAKARVVADGRVEFLFDLDKANNLDSLGEVWPDLFVWVSDAAGAVIFRSEVVPNVRFLVPDRTTIDLDFPCNLDR
ncbi:MAG: hypothetical protein ACKPB4_19640 [Sphaerospermopsis kisseleviana]